MPTSIAVTNLAFGICLLLGLWRVIFHDGDFPALKSWVTLFITLLIVTKFISQLTTPYSPQFLHYFRKQWLLVAYFIPILLVRDQKTGSRALYLLMFSGLVTASYALFEHLVGWEPIHNQILEEHGGGYMAVGFFTFHLTYGGVALFILFFTASWGLFGSGRQSPIRSLFIVLLAAVGLFVSFARSALVGVATGSLLILFASPKKWRWRILTGLVVGMGALLLIVPGVWERMAMLFTTGPHDETPRIHLMQAAIEIIKRYPILGIGDGNWKTAFETLRLIRLGRFENYAHAHCDVLSITSDGGLIGLVVFLGIWVFFFRTAWRAFKRASADSEGRWVIVAGMSGIAGILLAGLFQNYLSDSEVGNVVWFTVGLTMALAGRITHEAASG